MGAFTKMSNGWELAMSSFKVLNANKQLLIFPILSGLSLLLVLGGSGYVMFSGAGWGLDNLQLDQGALYLVVFLYYVVNYFIIVFFNMALIHCTRLYFDGEEVSISKGLQFSVSRIHVILPWALFAATIGTILQAIQENAGWLGKIITGLIGIVWGVATFLVVPILAYEKLGPVDAVKRSGQLMKQKWGEGIGASFSFGLIFFLVFIISGIVSYAIGYYGNEMVGVAVFVLSIGMTFVIFSALQSIFISALYANVNGNIDNHFRQQLLDGLFESKE